MLRHLKAFRPLPLPNWWCRPNFAAAFFIGNLQYARFMSYIYVTTFMFDFGYTALLTALYYLPVGRVALVFGSLIGHTTPYIGACCRGHRLLRFLGS
ncbi:hypothetical protein K450DRAFT_226314 [Umbelopsis ramanniana AG]|uniref:Uncharacterized protein n=1 Tax=Umbelopsis ramanniana AG TaxID=1314678 RepID=A0AAD5EGL9_UMBRA|nr:uncharacterized protein K450DRAFT_226314 [Umbelopsis ramanniana AG]KAI8582650.1 hypothetical protein K450DRAFT_226314 [Umbelopsis ramanniana AG]